MELIVKPTAKCNFNCKFCAASGLDISYSSSKVPDQIKEVVNTLNPDGIIITGGEPLCCDPQYYEELLKSCNCNIIFTTNLKDFWLNPDKWTPIFKNERVRVGTSFNFGNTRMWNKDKVYDETSFRMVMDLFKERIGYVPPFIAVIDENNASRYMDHISLAKELGTYCRLNNALKMGRQGKHYPRYKVFKMWIDIIKAGLADYEQNCFERQDGKCPINSSLMCQSSIRTIYIDSDGKIHYSNCEDKLNRDNGDEIAIDDVRPSQEPTPITFDEAISYKCLSCELYNICNACNTNREAAKEDPNYCIEMTKLKDDIIDLGWRL